MKKNKKKKRGKFAIFLILFFTVFITLYSFSNKILIELGIATYSGMLSSASYYALSKSLEPNFDFGSYFNVEKNSNGDVTMVTTNSYKFNLLANKLVDEVSNYFEEHLSKGVDVPICAFTGIGLISGFGKKVKMPLITVYSVRCDIYSTFTDAGINQTKHSLIINIIPEVYVVTRISTKDLTDKISVLIYENVIVGKIPDTYLEGSIISTQKSLK